MATKLHTRISEALKRMKNATLKWFLGGLATIFFGLIAMSIYNSYINSSEQIGRISYKGITAECPEEHTGTIKDAIANIEHGNYKDAITGLKASLLADQNLPPSFKRTALINALIGECYLSIDSLELSESYLLKSFNTFNTLFVCQKLTDLYYQLYKEFFDDNYLEKRDLFLQRERELSNTIISHLNNGILNKPLIQIDPSESSSGTTYLLSIGIQDYFDSGILDLKYPESDVIRVGNSLGDHFKNLRRIDLLGSNATKDNIEKALIELRNKLKVHDHLIVQYSGHGFNTTIKGGIALGDIDGDQDLDLFIDGNRGQQYPWKDKKYIIPFDARNDNLERTSISVEWITDALKQINTLSNPLVMIDACDDYPIPIADSLRSIDPKDIKRERRELDLPNNVIVISSSSPGQRSAEVESLKAGLFSYELIKALDDIGEMDLNRDREISFLELFNRLNENIRSYSQSHLGYSQTPNITIEN